MPNIHISVTDKIAIAAGNPEIVCGNSYVIEFDFDSEWDAYEAKTARFVWRECGSPVYRDVLFTGDSVQMPPVYGTYEIAAGVYAGDIRTTTPARIPCIPCITDGAPHHADPAPDVYNQLMDYLAGIQGGKSVLNAVLSADAVPPAQTVHGDEFEEVQ